MSLVEVAVSDMKQASLGLVRCLRNHRRGK